MAEQVGPMEVCCDAPPYAIVRACREVGFRTPEDVRWNRMSYFLISQAVRRGYLHPMSWKLLPSVSTAELKRCSCGEVLPNLEGYTFTLSSGEELLYFLGQCPRCRSIFWEKS